MSLDPRPHQAYIAAVAAAAGVDSHQAPGDSQHVVAYPEAHGLLTAALHYTQRGVGSTALPNGVTLRWDQRAGWRYVPGGRPNAPETPLPVPILASPNTVAGLLAELLDDRTTRLTSSTEQFPLSQTHQRLLGRLDVIGQLEDDGWVRRDQAPDEPVALACGSVVWRLTDDHEDIWFGGDWRDSRLSGLLWSTPYTVSVPGEVIVAAARAAVTAARRPVPA
ncbi:hypothetical protein [Streptomyces niveus]|uniref:hypothetical protein n=1 Tax=Streptomyces niveus TaxID=193462 RepID=UPI00342E7650